MRADENGGELDGAKREDDFGTVRASPSLSAATYCVGMHTPLWIVPGPLFTEIVAKQMIYLS